MAQIPAAASGTTITMTAPPDMSINNDYVIDIYVNDSSGPVVGRSISVSVTSPDSSSTINSPVMTDGSGHAIAVLHTSSGAGYNNITAISGIDSSTVSLLIGPGVAHSLNLAVEYPFALADGYGTITAKAQVKDAYDNPVGNVPVTFANDGTTIGPLMTDDSGVASISVGPYSTPHIADITADTPGIDSSGSVLSGTVTFLLKSNLFLVRYPGATASVNSDVSAVAIWYYDLTNNTRAAGVPLNFTAYGPDYSYLGQYSGVTDANGTLTFDFRLSTLEGNNVIIVSNGMLSTSPLQKTYLEGIPGDARRLTLSSTPSSPIYADGTTGYMLEIRSLDDGGAPVKYKYVTIVKNGDVDNSIGTYTNSNGYAWIDIGPSKYVEDVNIAVYTSTANNTTISNSTILRYVAGTPSSIGVYANPYVVASADVLTPPGMPDVHQTDITAIVTDRWGHPIPGQHVSISSLDTALGVINGPTDGDTTGSGEFTTQFKLNDDVYGDDLVNGVPVSATSGSLNGTCNVFYTNNSFLSVKSTIDPDTNVSVNDTINVTLTIRGIGWKIRPQNSSISLIFDTSGSMDWASTIIYPDDYKPKSGYIEPWNYTTWSSPAVDPRDWHLIDTFHYTGNDDIQFILSSNYRKYGWYGSYYYLKVCSPDGDFSTDTMYTSDVQNAQNENIIKFHNAKPGTYEIYGSYVYDSAKGDVPYNMMVLAMPKRLGQATDLDSAAKVAATGFVANMTNSQIGVVWFNVSSDVAQHLTIDNSVSRSAINASINGLSARGGTSIYLGIDKAISDFNSPYYASGNRKFAILLSDGYSQTTANDLASAQVAADQNITIYTIGMGMPDDTNLGAIANLTGGNYSRVYTDAQLNDVYSSISRDLRDIVANYTEVHLLSNCTYANSTWTPDAQYVPGSGIVTYPDGTVSLRDPDPMPFIDANGSYNIAWSPGVIKLNDTWSVTYSLKVNKEGNMTPIRNDSYIYFIRDDGSEDTMHFGSATLFVSDSTNNPMVVPDSPISVNITHPLLKAGALIESLNQPIVWDVVYTGNRTYHQKIYMVDKNSNEVLIGYGYDGFNNATYTYILNVDRLNYGDYTIRVRADDGIHSGNDTVVIIIPYNTGQITLI